MEKLFLLDAYALIYRAYYAMIRSPRITTKGVNTSAIFGFCNTLDEVLKKENPTHIAVVFDPSGPTFRHEAYAEYKANRDKQPEDITVAVPYIKEILNARHIPVIEVPGYEADDVIGTVSRLAEHEGFKTYMMTPDKDYGQLVTDNVLIYKPAMRGGDVEILGVEQIKAKYDIESTKQVIDILALEGDAVDNIPGCPGVGQKTAQKLVKEWGSVENLLANTDKIKGALQKKLSDNREQIAFSKFLATIKTDVPVDIKAADLRRGELDRGALKKVYEELEFRSLINRLGDDPKEVVEKQPDKPKEDVFGGPGSLFDLPDEEADTKAAAPSVRIAAAPLRGEDEIRKAVAQICAEAQEVGVVIYSEGEQAVGATIRGVALADDNGGCVYVETPRDAAERRKIIGLLAPVFNSNKLTVVSHETKRDRVLLANEGVTVTAKCFDTQLAHYIVDTDARHTLPEVAFSYLGVETWDYNVEPRLRKPYGNHLSVDAMMHSCEYAGLILRLRKPLQKQIDEMNLTHLYYDIELPMAEVLARMELNGMRIDLTELKRLSTEYTARMEELEEKVFEIAGIRFNTSSPSQVGEILFGQMKIDQNAKRTKKGGYSTTEEILEKFRAQYPIVDYILKIRQLKKLLSTYIDMLPTLIDKSTGKIHSTFNQTVTATGRLSSTNPNLQNIPVRGSDGREVRRAFVADDGDLLMSADYSQIELRLMADISGDKEMIEAFMEGEDIHRATASKIYHTPLAEVTEDQRRNAKTANFGIIYGISAFGLSERLGIPRQESKKLIEDYMRTYPQVQEYITNIIEKGREDGFVTTFTGRRRMLPEITSRNAVVRGYGERNAVNAPLQGSAADIIKIAMIAIDKRLREEGFRSTMILQVHDELLFNVKPDELDRLQKMVTEEMTAAYSGKVSMTVSVGVGHNWLEAH
ncbi:MAG: DNA polymerase I [Muribaculaceae bacterium]|nr:DNA polymerase I [Muribaculaceae bacterium]